MWTLLWSKRSKGHIKRKQKQQWMSVKVNVGQGLQRKREHHKRRDSLSKMERHRTSWTPFHWCWRAQLLQKSNSSSCQPSVLLHQWPFSKIPVLFSPFLPATQSAWFLTGQWHEARCRKRVYPCFSEDWATFFIYHLYFLYGGVLVWVQRCRCI